MIVFTEDCDRVKRKEAAASMAVAGKKEEAAASTAGAGKNKEAAASMAGPGKKEEAAASEPRVPLDVLFPLGSTAEPRPAGAGKKRKEATEEKKRKEAIASESGDGALNKERDSLLKLLKEGEMLKLREELWELEDLWMDGLVEGALDRWLEERNKTTQKKRKVVRVAVPDAYIHFIMENPTLMRELSDEEMAECPQHHRQLYVIQKLLNDKKRSYQKALIDQYNTFGFAYDENEVKDDDDDKEVAVAKN